MSCNVICGDLTKTKADAIIFSANPEPVCGRGLDMAIYEAAGFNELLTERIRIGKISVGDAKATPAFALDAKYLIHTVAPLWNGGSSGEYDAVRTCYENSFKLALELGCKTVATCLIATGVNGFSKDNIMKLLTAVAEEYNSKHGLDITIVLYEKEDTFDDKRMKIVRDHIIKSLNGEVTKLERNIDLERMHKKQHYESVYNSLNPKKPVVDLDALLLSSEASFKDRVNALIEERQLKPATIYKAADISKQTFSKVTLDDDYHPNKYTAVALCLAFNLDLMDTLELLESAGWTLSRSNKMDLVVRACIINGIYDIKAVNKLLAEHGLDELKCIK
ncbi:MAG: macro domain-containing protein [Saccharofermentans sp.]|nr:macro domain-containing protein [Saccharofermentans sp.]